MRKLCADCVALLGPADPPAFPGPVRPKVPIQCASLSHSFTTFCKQMKIYIKPKELNEEILQKETLRATQKEMKSIQKVSKKDLNIEFSKK